MASARRPAPRPSRRRTPRSAPPAPPRAVPPRRNPGPVETTEDPHSHIVCHACGRIQTVELSDLDRHLLTELAGLRPDGWSVDRIAFSLAGACRRCREGPDAP